MIVTVFRYANEPENGHWFSFRIYEGFEQYNRPYVGGKYLYEYQITINHPYIINAKGCVPPIYPVKLYETLTGKPIYTYWDNRFAIEAYMADILKEKGYDSVIFRNSDCDIYEMTAENGNIDLWLLNPVKEYRNYVRRFYK
jgi:hypothetical protein